MPTQCFLQVRMTCLPQQERGLSSPPCNTTNPRDPESGQPTEPAFQRDFLAHELKGDLTDLTGQMVFALILSPRFVCRTVTDDPRFTHVPLLYGVVASLQRPRGQLQADS
jgi:hypothetical protein